MTEPLRISFCTTCMGRLDHLQESLPENLANLAGYDNAELVILAYGDRETFDWVKQEYPQEIRDGRIRLAFSEQPHFRMSHAKNMAHRLGTGDVLVNLDADNIIGKGFVQWLDKEYQKNQNLVVRARTIGRTKHTLLGGKPLRGIFGRISVSKEAFNQMHGYDEVNFEGWGGEDRNFFSRLIAEGHSYKGIPIRYFGHVLQHTDEARVDNMDEKGQEASKEYLSPEKRTPVHKRVLREISREICGKPNNLDENIEGANPKGDFGCGTVELVNQSLEVEEMELTPKISPHWQPSLKQKPAEMAVVK